MPLTQLMPFNESRFDACMAFLAARHQRLLTQYDMVKLHIMIDVFHVLEHGKPVIGGEISPWTFGPVVTKAYHRVRRWESQFIKEGHEPESFRLVGSDGNALQFEPTVIIDPDEFSPSELTAMDTAWRRVMSMNWSESQDFFHNPRQFMGRAWTSAKKEDRRLDWKEIIAAYEELNDLTHPAIKTIIDY